MSSSRPYRRKLQLEEVKEEIRRNSGTHFDPSIANVLLELLDKQKITLEISLWKESEGIDSEYFEDNLSKEYEYMMVGKENN
jgi:HD-GYP domain-containing protein (c-di-GMP phosphodiesterase class II)